MYRVKGELFMTHYLKQYAYFTNKFDLDHTVTLHKEANWEAMNNTDRAILDILRQYSVKYGAAHLKHSTIEQIVKKSNATVRRSLRKLCKLKIIDRIHYVRPVMNGLGANIYAVKPFYEKEVESVQEKETAPKKACHFAEKEERPVSTSLFSRMKTMLASTIGNDSKAREFFGIYRHVTVPLLKFDIHAQKGDLFEQLGVRALQIATQASKRKKIHNLLGYYAGVLRELIDEHLFVDMGDIYEEAVAFFMPEKRST